MNAGLTTLLAALLLGTTLQAGELQIQVSDAAGKPVDNAALWLKPVAGPLPAPPAKAVHATVDQVERSFKPLLSVIRTGTLVDFPNSDNIRHSVYSFSPSKVFTLKLYSGRQAEPVLFDKEGFVTLGCNIHDQMIAWVVVVDSPWFAKSAVNGTATIAAVPEGEYLLSAWHPGLKQGPVTLKLRVPAGTTSRALQLDAAPLASLLPDSEGQVHATREH